jgi:5-methylcytosine-specific restriction enzyme subunit McrC
MANKAKISLKAKDCSPFDENPEIEYVKSFLDKMDRSNLILDMSSKDRFEDKSPLAERFYDSVAKENKWCAGRYIGELAFYENKRSIKVTIEPRFGNNHLSDMLSEIYNIRITKTKTDANSENKEVWIKKILSIIWLNKLAAANKFGLPRTNVKESYKGHFIKGRINIRKSIAPFLHNKQIVSDYNTKQYDEVIIRILNQAYNIMSSNFVTNIPENAQDAINKMSSFSSSLSNRVSLSEYKNIQYKSIYQSYKDIVDFSWNIINNKSSSMSTDLGSKDGFGLFIDMAEIWELYLEKVLKKHFDGWDIRSQNDFPIYNKPKMFYYRSIRPDIFMQNKKEKKIAVFDAKWKKMDFEWKDFDRADFFQINTYIAFLKTEYPESEVVCGGLLYPLTEEISVNNSHAEKWLNNSETKFIVDGIQMKKNDEEYEYKTQEFIDRLKQILN